MALLCGYQGQKQTCVHNERLPRGVVLIGKRFGRLLVVAAGPGRIEPCSGLPRRNWECLCECGRRTVSMETNLKFGRSTSCGHHSVSNYRHGEAANDVTTPEWRLNVNGQKVAAMDIVESNGLPASTFYGRLQLGWSTEEACGLVARAGAK